MLESDFKAPAPWTGGLVRARDAVASVATAPDWRLTWVLQRVINALTLRGRQRPPLLRVLDVLAKGATDEAQGHVFATDVLRHAAELARLAEASRTHRLAVRLLAWLGRPDASPAKVTALLQGAIADAERAFAAAFRLPADVPAVSDWVLPTPPDEPEYPNIAILFIALGAPGQVIRGLHRLATTAFSRRIRVIIARDRVGMPEIDPILAWLSEAARIEIATGDGAGFSAALNAGLARTSWEDVVILNPRARVFGDWLDRLARHKVADIWVIAPVCDDAGWWTHPFVDAARLTRPGADAGEIDQILARHQAGRQLPLAASTGLCLYLARSCVAALGPLGAVTDDGTGLIAAVGEVVTRAQAKAILALDVFMGQDDAPLRPRATGDQARAIAALEDPARRAAARAAPAASAIADIPLVAFYLPQFHPIPENDAFWGPGFTEWTNVVQAAPLYPGHEQPHVPRDLGFYDLRLDAVREAQARLARDHGVSAFCYHFYWFDGRWVMDLPMRRLLETGAPDFPFCLCWANENWTRRWDGAEQEVLIGQTYGSGWAGRMIDDLMPWLADPRYVRVEDRPVLVIYRTGAVPDLAAATAEMRARAVERGLPGLFLLAAETFCGFGAFADPRPEGFDGSVEFPPHGLKARNRNDQVLGPLSQAAVYDMGEVALQALSRPDPGHPVYRTVVPSWDNTARRKHRATILDGASPALFEAWLRETLLWTIAHHEPERRMVFINAWNEWAEGCHLEPDLRHGLAWLEAVAAARATAARALAP